MLVPGVGSGYALFQSHFWFYVQGLYQFFVAQDGALDVSGAEWCVLHFRLVSYGPFEGSDQVVDARFGSCRYVDRVAACKGQCLYDSRCDVSGIDEVPCLISIVIDGMDDCRKMITGKGQVEHSTMLAMNQSLLVRLMKNLAAGALVYIRYMVVMLCAYISFRYLR